MAIKIDKEKCIGCGSCEAMCPDVFELGEDGKAFVKSGFDLEQNKPCIKESINVCPVQAISQED